MDALHQAEYDLGKAMCALIPPTGPILCRDQMEEWSASEANLFEEAMGNIEIPMCDYLVYLQSFVWFYHREIRERF
jgi:hypothetical protein